MKTVSHTFSVGELDILHNSAEENIELRQENEDGSFTFTPDELGILFEKYESYEDVDARSILGFEGWSIYPDAEGDGDYDGEKGAMTDYEICLYDDKDKLRGIGQGGYFTGVTGHCFNHSITFEPTSDYDEEFKRIQPVVDALNQAYKDDPECMEFLITHKTSCNSKLANNPHVQVQVVDNGNSYRVGALGLINAALSSLNLPLVAAMYEDNELGILKGFTMYEEPKE